MVASSAWSRCRISVLSNIWYSAMRRAPAVVSNPAPVITATSSKDRIVVFSDSGNLDSIVS